MPPGHVDDARLSPRYLLHNMRATTFALYFLITYRRRMPIYCRSMRRHRRTRPPANGKMYRARRRFILMPCLY